MNKPEMQHMMQTARHGLMAPCMALMILPVILLAALAWPPCASAQSADQDPAALLNAARMQISGHQLDAAEQNLLEIIRLHQNSPLRADAYQELSRVYEIMNRPSEAAAVLEELYTNDPNGPMAPQALYNRGRLLGNAGRREDAAAIYKLLIQRFPDNSMAVNAAQQLAALLLTLGRPEDAVAALKPVLKSSNENDVLQARRTLADIYFQLQRWYEAETEINKILAAEPGNNYYREMLARIFKAQDEMGKAIPIYEFLYDQNPANGHFETELFSAYDKAGVLDKKIEQLEQRKSKNSKDLDPVRRLARIYLWQDRSLDALVQFEILVQAQPGNLENAVTLARLYYRNQWKQKALDTLNAVLAKNPLFTDAWRELGDIQYAEGDMARARDAWEKAVNFSPADAPSYNRLGNVLTGKQLFKEASDLYEQGRAALGGDLLFSNELIYLYGIQSRARDAVTEFLHLIAAGQPDSGLSAGMLALITGEDLKNDAFTILDPWLARAPDMRPLLGFYVSAAVALDRMDKARAALNTYAAAHPDQPDIFYDTARSLLDAGRYKGAADLFEAAVDRPLPLIQQSAALMGAARACLWGGDPARARAFLKRLTRDFPDTPDAPEAAFRLAELQADEGLCTDAIQGFTTLLASKPEGPYANDALLGRGRCLVQRGLYNEAETDLLTLWSRPGASAYFDEILFLQGESRFLRGVFKDAETYYRRIAESQPQSRYVNDALTRLLFITAAAGVDPIAVQAYMEAVRERAAGNLDRAATLFEGMTFTLNDTPLAAHAQFELARTRLDQGHATDAERLFLDIAAAGPDSELFAPALLRAAEIQTSQGRAADALRTFQRLLDLDPGNFWAHVARDKVQELIPLLNKGSS